MYVDPTILWGYSILTELLMYIYKTVLGTAAGSADIRCYDSGDTTLSDLTLGFCDELVPSSFYSMQGRSRERYATQLRECTVVIFGC
jgi:muramoyltetrapeptide carboxypeptidase LdcA involved in peptidoglycan recycling